MNVLHLKTRGTKGAGLPRKRFALRASTRGGEGEVSRGQIQKTGRVQDELRGYERRRGTESIQVANNPPSYMFDVAAEAAQSGGNKGLMTALVFGAVGAASVGAKLFQKGSRTYDDNVGEEYDSWTSEGVLEYYWGEHIHLGYYNEEELAKGWKKKDFKEAKYDFIEEMLKWSEAKDPKNILDVGCGIGGTSRYLAKKFPEAKVTGITISEMQVKRATELAREQGLTNVEFKLVNALDMSFDDDQFDLVWGCESGEHMPDKKKYVEEMTRVLAPGGHLAIATWCQRHSEEGKNPLTEEEKNDLQFLYDEWAHPYFISIQDYDNILNETGHFDKVQSNDWTVPTIASWRHSIWVGVVDPWIVVRKGPVVWYKTVREIVTLERMHRAFASGLMQYGMIKGTKKAATNVASATSSTTASSSVDNLKWVGETSNDSSPASSASSSVDELRWIGETSNDSSPKSASASPVDELRWIGEEA